MKLHVKQHATCKVVVGYDDTSAEQWATAAAMFSRSNDGIEVIKEKLTADKSERFMKQNYIGYNHASIGDLADIKVFIEGVPMYVACMLEHFSRFRGQEASTRYIDFSKQPCAYDADSNVYNNQIAFYLMATEIVRETLLREYAKRDDSKDPVFIRAVNARTFDICRSLIPWSATTNVAWYGDIRTIMSHLAWLISDKNTNRDITRIRPYVEDIYSTIAEVYPSSVKMLEDTRPGIPYSEGDYHLALFGNDTAFQLDFGSWRDLNRHRVGSQKVFFNSVLPQLHPWYVEMLDRHCIGTTHLMPPTTIDTRLLGHLVSYQYYFGDQQAKYLVFRRGQDDVHPTLRNNILKFASNEGITPPQGEPDPGPFGFFLRRGTQTIIIGG